MYPRTILYPARAEDTYINLSILKAKFEIVVDSLVRHLAQQREIRNTNLLLLCALKNSLLHLRLSFSLSPIANIGLRLGAAEATTALVTTTRTSRLTLEKSNVSNGNILTDTI
jgi:hypothetical protein